MAPLDLAILAAFLVYTVAVGLAHRRRASRGLDDYFLAGRSLSGWQAGLSMAATQFAADTPLLVTGLVAAGGLFALWRLWIYALAFLLLAFVLAACWRRAGVLTDAEFVELRYADGGAPALRAFKAVYFGVVFNCAALAIVLLAATRLAEPFLIWHAWLPEAVYAPVLALAQTFDIALTATPRDDPAFWTRAADNLISILALALLTAAYSTLGGLAAVVRTDVVQFAIMMVASLGYAAVVIRDTGGFGALGERLHATFTEAVGPVAMDTAQLVALTPGAAGEIGAAFAAVLLLQWLIQVNADGTGYLAQRAMACRDEHEARRAVLVFTFAQVVVRSLVWLPIVLGLLLLFPPDAAQPRELYVAEREATFVRGIAELLPIGLKGLMVTGMLAALASTVDTHLNWGASYLANDLYRRFAGRLLGREPGPRALVWVARASSLLLLLLALGVMVRLGTVRAAWEASLLLGAGVGAVLVLRWLWWRMTAWGELGAIAASAIAIPLSLAAIPEAQAPLRLLVVALVSTTAAIVMSVAFRPASPEALVAFYRRVRPPGAWAPVATLAGEPAGDPRRRLARGLAATALASVTVFGLLVGLATWLVEAPAPSWLPHREGWMALTLGAAILATPLWLRLGATR